MARTVAGSLALLCALALASCGDDGNATSDRSGTTTADLEWDLSDSTALSDPCGTHVVRSDIDEPLQVVDVAADRVVQPEVTQPDGSDLEIDGSWFMSGGCVLTPEGPVVVVEVQDRFAELEDAPAKVFAGFTPAGEQLWARELPGAYLGSYDGRGSFVVDEIGKVPGAWLVVDARTGETVAEGQGDAGEPTVAVARDLALTVDEGVVRLPGGETWIAEGVAQVDEQHLLAAGPDGLRLVRLADATTVWERSGGAGVLGVWSETADLSTGVVVAQDGEGAIVGLDLASGETRWTSPLDRTAINPIDAQIGSGVLVLKDADDLDRQVLLSTETGEELTGAEGSVVAGQEVLLLVDEHGRPRRVTVDDLR